MTRQPTAWLDLLSVLSALVMSKIAFIGTCVMVVGAFLSAIRADDESMRFIESPAGVFTTVITQELERYPKPLPTLPSSLAGEVQARLITHKLRELTDESRTLSHEISTACDSLCNFLEQVHPLWYKRRALYTLAWVTPILGISVMGFGTWLIFGYRSSKRTFRRHRLMRRNLRKYIIATGAAILVTILFAELSMKSSFGNPDSQWLQLQRTAEDFWNEVTVTIGDTTLKEDLAGEMAKVDIQLLRGAGRLDALEKECLRVLDLIDAKSESRALEMLELVSWLAVLITGPTIVGLALLKTYIARLYLRRTCPQCLRVRQLRTIDLRDDLASPNQRGATRSPDIRLEALSCQNCGYRFLPSHAEVDRLYIPTMGVPGAGKTIWLAMFYYQAMHTAGTNTCDIEYVPTIGDIPDDWNLSRMTDQMIGQGESQLAATKIMLPVPAVFAVRDLMRESVLVTISDYSGEIYRDSLFSGKTDEIAQFKLRALRSDAFLIFIDPVQTDKKRQLEALRQFLSDLRDARGIKPGKEIPCPAAVCFTKLDEFSEEKRGSAFAGLKEELEKVGSGSGTASLDEIMARADVIERYLPTIFSGADIMRQLRNAFAGMCLAFPVSSFGFDTSRSPDGRQLYSPYGVVEPVLWLMHMRGYDVF